MGLDLLRDHCVGKPVDLPHIPLCFLVNAGERVEGRDGQLLPRMRFPRFLRSVRPDSL